jgi:hypothetical protein
MVRIELNSRPSFLSGTPRNDLFSQSILNEFSLVIGRKKARSVSGLVTDIIYTDDLSVDEWSRSPQRLVTMIRIPMDILNASGT